MHQQDLSVEEKILRLFDMSSQFGVFTSRFLLLLFLLAIYGYLVSQLEREQDFLLILFTAMYRHRALKALDAR